MKRASRGPAPLDRDRLVHLLDRMRSQRIVVVGDVMLDRYLVGDTERVSPEAPVPVVHVREQRTTLGGAANVAANVAAIGAECRLAGVVGDDQHGATVRQELARCRLVDAHVLAVAGRPTTAKTRVMARGQQLVRVDEEIDTPLDRRDAERLAQVALGLLDGADGLLIEDYDKGAIGPALIRPLMAAARKGGIPVVVDPKSRHFFEYAGATVFKPNQRELEAALGAPLDPGNREAVVAALDRLAVDNLLVTLGAAGMLIVAKDRTVTEIPSMARQVFDVSGAGDTVTAWLGTALAAGASLAEAAQLANYAAGIEVGKVGVATVLPEEVVAAHEAVHDRIGTLRRSGLI